MLAEFIFGSLPKLGRKEKKKKKKKKNVIGDGRPSSFFSPGFFLKH